jgi:hypothetical protein
MFNYYWQDAICLETHIDKVAAGWQTSIRKGCQLLYDEAVKRNGSDLNFSAGMSSEVKQPTSTFSLTGRLFFVFFWSLVIVFVPKGLLTIWYLSFCGWHRKRLPRTASQDTKQRD